MTLSGFTFVRQAVGLSCLLAIAGSAAPALAQSRGGGAVPRHGAGQSAQPVRMAVPRDAGVRHALPARVPGRIVSHARPVYGPSRVYSSRAYTSRSYSSVAVPRHGVGIGRPHIGTVYAQRRHGSGHARPYYRPYHRPYYRPYYRHPRTFVGLGFGYGYPFGYYGHPFSYWSPYPFYGGWYGYAPYAYGPYGYGNGYGYGRSEYAEDQGGIRLQMKPKEATVYADGYYVGIVDDFDGSYQHLRLDAGVHKIEVRAPGFEPLTIDVNILRYETIRYRGVLRPLQP